MIERRIYKGRKSGWIIRVAGRIYWFRIVWSRHTVNFKRVEEGRL